MDVTLEAKMIKIPKQEYTVQFKEQAVKRVAEVGRIGRVAEELGLVEQTVRNWVKAAKAGKLNPTGAHAITPEQLSDLLNAYLDQMSDIVLSHGGTIDKFVGDAIIAFWGAPIARPDDAERAVRAAIAMQQGGLAFARNADPELPPIGITRVGLHFGDAVIGNFGGKGRIQYTAFGDGMNTAARLESANKALKTVALVSSEAKDRAGLDLFRPMGRVVLSGRATPIEVWEPAPDMDPALRDELNALWIRFDGGDAEALVHLEIISAAHKDDAALREFVYRLREAGSGGHFVLGSK